MSSTCADADTDLDLIRFMVADDTLTVAEVELLLAGAGPQVADADDDE